MNIGLKSWRSGSDRKCAATAGRPTFSIGSKIDDAHGSKLCVRTARDTRRIKLGLKNILPVTTVRNPVVNDELLHHVLCGSRTITNVLPHLAIMPQMAFNAFREMLPITAVMAHETFGAGIQLKQASRVSVRLGFVS